MQVFTSRAHKDSVYAAMLEHIDCGPFDGGCVSFALALQRVLGGEVQVITGNLRWNPRSTKWAKGAQHAVLQLPDGRLMDALGPGTHDEVVSRFLREEITPPASMQFTGVRALRPRDLPDAPRDEKLIEKLAGLLSHLRLGAEKQRAVQPWMDDRRAPNGNRVRDNFSDWFDDSKVVGPDGDPLTVYHGTKADFFAFRDTHGGEDGHYFTEGADLAARYAVWAAGLVAGAMEVGSEDHKDYLRAEEMDPAIVMPVYLAIRNPLTMTPQEFLKGVTNDGINHYLEGNEGLARRGYDGLHITADPDDADWEAPVWVAFRPEQIKSAIGNSGNYDHRSTSLTDGEPQPRPQPKGMTP